jgi:hypothetical protein
MNIYEASLSRQQQGRTHRPETNSFGHTVKSELNACKRPSQILKSSAKRTMHTVKF